MNDLISRQAAIDAINVPNIHQGIIDALQSIIQDLPSAQPEIIYCKVCKNNMYGECMKNESTRHEPIY